MFDESFDKTSALLRMLFGVGPATIHDLYVYVYENR
jgi:hypothetical protein